MNIRIVNNDKSKLKYKYFLTVFYGLIFFVSLKQIIALFTGHLVKTSQVVDIPFNNWTFQMWVNPLISMIITILSIVIIILVIKKKLPKFNLVFPIYYLLFLLSWAYIIPSFTWSQATSHAELLHMVDNQDKYYIIHPIIEFLFSSLVLLKLWKGNKRRSTKR